MLFLTTVTGLKRHEQFHGCRNELTSLSDIFYKIKSILLVSVQ